MLANETHQIAGVGKFTTHAMAAGQVAAQGDQPLDARLLQRLQLLQHLAARSTNA